MDWFLHTMRANPSIPIFLAIGIGFWVGKFSFRGISLGTVTSVLLAGVALGQMNIPIGEPLQSLFFMLF
ncbi:MAG: aspartate-alanine antiporter, partial [Desulfovibrio sp.]|nr:aspartate-alanine antiporter [Desulfovibrio sp.]